MDNIKTNKKKKIISIIIILILLLILIASFYIGAFFLSTKEYYKDEKNISIPIFVYHRIVEKIDGPDYMQTSKNNFKEQMERTYEFRI